MREPIFTTVTQVCVVVRDLDAAMKTYVERYGIGPWRVFEGNPGTIAELTKDGRPATHSFRFASAQLGEFWWELIQPLQGDSIYREFLEQKGEGVQHLGLAVRDYDAALAELDDMGVPVLESGRIDGIRFAYVATDRDLGVVGELYHWPEGVTPREPDYVYP